MKLQSLPPFVNEPYRDFKVPEHKADMESALALVRSQLGKEYLLILGGKQELGGKEKLLSNNPSHPSELVGIHQKATSQQAASAVEFASQYFPTWAAVPAEERASKLF